MEFTDDDLSQFGLTGAQLPDVGQSKKLIHNGAELYFRIFGTGLPVILLHGGLGHSGNWAFQIDAITGNGYSAIVVDTRGHGQSTRDEQPFSYDLLASDLLAVITHLDLPKVFLLGWSDGACTALVLSKMIQEKIAGVIYFACNMDPSGVAESISFTPALQNCINRHKKDYQLLSKTPADFDRLSSDLEIMQKTQPNFSKRDLEEISVPVAVLHSENDEFIRPEHAKYLAESIPHACFEHLRGVSHFAPLQRPALFNKAVLKYLNRFR